MAEIVGKWFEGGICRQRFIYRLREIRRGKKKGQYEIWVKIRPGQLTKKIVKAKEVEIYA